MYNIIIKYVEIHSQICKLSARQGWRPRKPYPCRRRQVHLLRVRKVLNNLAIIVFKSIRHPSFASTSRRTLFSTPSRQSSVSLIEEALLYLIDLLLEKTTLKDFGFFLNNGNFLKVVDTLEKFEEGLLDKDSPRAREFILFKRQLYAMYEVQNRSVNEHELFSFEVERHNLSWLYNANTEFVQEMHRVDQNDQLADYTRLGKDEVFRRRALSPRRFKGLGAFASSWALYSYAPYVAMYFGATFPILGAVCAGLYGMLQFSES